MEQAVTQSATLYSQRPALVAVPQVSLKCRSLVVVKDDNSECRDQFPEFFVFNALFPGNSNHDDRNFSRPRRWRPFTALAANSDVRPARCRSDHRRKSTRWPGAGRTAVVPGEAASAARAPRQRAQACDLSVGLAGQGGSQPSFRRQDLGAARQVGARSLPQCGFRAMQSMWRRGSFILHPVARPERRGFASTQRSLRRTPRPLGGVLRSRRAIGRRSWLSNRNEYGTLARWKRKGSCFVYRVSEVSSPGARWLNRRMRCHLFSIVFKVDSEGTIVRRGPLTWAKPLFGCLTKEVPAVEAGILSSQVHDSAPNGIRTYPLHQMAGELAYGDTVS